MKEISTVIKSLLSRKQLEILQTVVDALNNGILRSERNMVTVHDDWYAPTGIETIVSTWYDGHLQDTDLVRIVRERINSDGSITEVGKACAYDYLQQCLALWRNSANDVDNEFRA